MKLTFNEILEYIETLEEELHMFELRSDVLVKHQGFDIVFMQHGMMQRAIRELKLSIDNARLETVTYIDDEPISYNGLRYFVHDLSTNRSFFKSLHRLLDDKARVYHSEVVDLIEHSEEGLEIFQQYLEDFEEQHLIDLDDELYMHLQEWV